MSELILPHLVLISTHLIPHIIYAIRCDIDDSTYCNILPVIFIIIIIIIIIIRIAHEVHNKKLANMTCP